MLGCECFYWSSKADDGYKSYYESDPYFLPSPIPEWPQGQGFATGRISLGELEVFKNTKLERICSYNNPHGKTKGVSFYRPVEIPDGFFTLGHYCQPNDQPLRGYVLVARELDTPCLENDSKCHFKDEPALRKPTGYTLIWDTDSRNGECYFWLPNPQLGYKAVGFVVTSDQNEPPLEEVRCVRTDLTETCEISDILLDTGLSFSRYPFQVWRTRPCSRGMLEKGVPVGTFFCSTILASRDELNIACLKNLDLSLKAMPNLDQIHALIKHYGPTLYFHPDEVYMPSSVSWYFENGAVLCQENASEREPIDFLGLNLPCGGENDGEFWIDLPKDDEKREYVKRGNIETAKLYVHIKPASGGSFTDIAMWIFCPFNGPATLKVGVMSLSMAKVGEHVGDWEHFTLRVSNFTGELWGAYFSEHSGGGWVDAPDMEFISGNKPIVYSSKNGHASFPHPGTYLQGSLMLGVGIRNDCAPSKYFIDSSRTYEIVSAEYLGDGVVEEPCWLQYMREWGPTIVYDSRAEVERIIKLLPAFVRFSVENIFELFPTELYGEEGPTGPKEKDNWLGDERD